MYDEEDVMKDFGWALRMLKGGRQLYRHDWNGPDQYLELLNPTSNSIMTIPCIFIKTTRTELTPWFPTQSDMLACDWEVV